MSGAATLPLEDVRACVKDPVASRLLTEACHYSTLADLLDKSKGEFRGNLERLLACVDRKSDVVLVDFALVHAFLPRATMNWDHDESKDLVGLFVPHLVADRKGTIWEKRYWKDYNGCEGFCAWYKPGVEAAFLYETSHGVHLIAPRNNPWKVPLECGGKAPRPRPVDKDKSHVSAEEAEEEAAAGGGPAPSSDGRPHAGTGGYDA